VLWYRPKSWKAAAVAARQERVSISARSVPSIRMRPESGRYIFSSSLTIVVLPGPYSPTTATTLPGGMVTEEFTRAGRRPPVWVKVTFSKVMPRPSAAGAGVVPVGACAAW
jgi:hypothetical protein